MNARTGFFLRAGLGSAAWLALSGASVWAQISAPDSEVEYPAAVVQRPQEPAARPQARSAVAPLSGWTPVAGAAAPRTLAQPARLPAALHVQPIQQTSGYAAPIMVTQNADPQTEVQRQLEMLYSKDGREMPAMQISELPETLVTPKEGNFIPPSQMGYRPPPTRERSLWDKLLGRRPAPPAQPQQAQFPQGRPIQQMPAQRPAPAAQQFVHPSGKLATNNQLAPRPPVQQPAQPQAIRQPAPHPAQAAQMPRGAGGQVYPQVPRGVPAQPARYPQAMPPRPFPVAGSAANFAPPQPQAPAYLPAAPQPLPVATAASSLPIAVRAVDDKTFEADNFAGSQDDLSESLEITPPAVPTDAAALPPGKVAEEPGTLPQTPLGDTATTPEPEALTDTEESPFSGLKLQTPDTPAAAPAEQAPSETIEIPAPKAPASPQQEQLRLLKEAKEKTGFKGFCPVLVKTHRKLVPARPEFSTEYNSRPYSFSSAQAKAAFDANPADYAPAADGYDAVFLGDIEEKIEGSLDHAAWFKGHLFLFANPENQQIFMTDPEQYATALEELKEAPTAPPATTEPAETEPATLPDTGTATPAQAATPADADADPKADAPKGNALKDEAEEEENPFGDSEEEEMPSLEVTPPANLKVESATPAATPAAAPIPDNAPVIQGKTPETPLLDDEEEADELDDGFEFADEPAEVRQDTNDKPAATSAGKPQATTPAADDLPLLLEEDEGPVIVPAPKPVTTAKPAPAVKPAAAPVAKPVPAAKAPVKPTRTPAAPPATLPAANVPLKAVPSRAGK